MAIDTSTPSEAPRVPGAALSQPELELAIRENEQVIRTALARAVALAHELANCSRKELPKD